MFYDVLGRKQSAEPLPVQYLRTPTLMTSSSKVLSGIYFDVFDVFMFFVMCFMMYMMNMMCL